MRCVQPDENVRKLPFSIFIAIISKFKIQVQEHVESAKSITLYGHFLIFIAFIQEKLHVLLVQSLHSKL
jgi:CRISPR/Cas system CMR-associated protein Cmr3 (group 5 of RAMP superfamily)